MFIQVYFLSIYIQMHFVTRTPQRIFDINYIVKEFTVVHWNEL